MFSSQPHLIATSEQSTGLGRLINSANFYSRLLLLCVLVVFGGCFKLSGNSWYHGPPERPPRMLEYYEEKGTYHGYREEIRETTDAYTLKHITIDTDIGPIVVDYYDVPAKTESLVLVFPVLGGKNLIEKHIAGYLAESGLDAAIINRSDEFKDPTKFDLLEDVLRKNIIRDRMTLDFFQNEYKKSKFGSFGISRGAINVALTAGIDERLKYNVLVLGGTDLISVFRDSNQGRIKKYVQTVSTMKGISKEQFFQLLRERLRTDPKNTAQYVDGRNTLLILGLFDRTVPFRHGMRLRDQLGRPATVFLLADHYLGFLFTQTVSLIPPRMGSGLFPFPYVEQEAVTFFRRSFDDSFNWRILPFRLMQLPFNLLAEIGANIGTAFEWLTDDKLKVADTDQEQYWLAAIKAATEASGPAAASSQESDDETPEASKEPASPSGTSPTQLQDQSK